MRQPKPCAWHVVAVAALLSIANPSCTAFARGLPGIDAIDAEARRLMAQEDVKGMALALIDDGQVVHIAAYGHRNVERDLPLQTDTVMYGASLTKTAVAYRVLQLVDEDRLDLDVPLATYLPKPLPEYPDYADLAGDDRWRALTLRHVLTHAAGFANFRWIEPDRTLRFHRAPGARYGYSGEGFQVLQTVLEAGLGLEHGADMQDNVFARFELVRTAMQWREDFADNLADGYAVDGSFEPHDERSRPRAAGSMDTTIADQARLWAAMVRGDGLSGASRAELVRAHLPIDSASQFPTLSPATDPRGPAIGLAAGLGVVVFDDPVHGPTWFKGGHNDWTGNMAICRERHRRCVVLLANSVRAERIYPALVEFVLGPDSMPWWWEYGND
jgi:CubicO group peptidase (beta-lactamase class C family)